jgi:surface protein
MCEMFHGAMLFNQKIEMWEVSNVTDMSQMFKIAISFNEDISGWDVSNVSNMQAMFMYATSFNHDIGDWNVSNVTDMSAMFWGLKVSIKTLVVGIYLRLSIRKRCLKIVILIRRINQLLQWWMLNWMVVLHVNIVIIT